MDDNHSRQLALGILLDNIIQGFEEAIRTGNTGSLDREGLLSSLAGGKGAAKSEKEATPKAPKPAKVIETIHLPDGGTADAEVKQEKTKGGRTRSYVEIDGEKSLVTKGKDGWRLRRKASRDFSDFVPEGVDRQILDALYVKNEGGVNPEWNELADAAGVTTGVLLASFRKLKGAGLAESDKEAQPSTYMLTEAGREFFESAAPTKPASPRKSSSKKSGSTRSKRTKSGS